MAEDLQKIVGQRLKLLRQEKQLTQEQMSEKLNIATSTYCKIEYGETDLTLSRLSQIAETLEMSAIELFSKIGGNVYNITNCEVGVAATENSTANIESDKYFCELMKANSRLIDLLSRQIEALEAKLQNKE